MSKRSTIILGYFDTSMSSTRLDFHPRESPVEIIQLLCEAVRFALAEDAGEEKRHREKEREEGQIIASMMEGGGERRGQAGGIGDWKCPLCFGFQSSDDGIAESREGMDDDGGNNAASHCWSYSLLLCLDAIHRKRFSTVVKP